MLSILALVILLSCDGVPIQRCPKYTFIGPFPKRYVDLSRRLGDEFELEEVNEFHRFVPKDSTDSETKPEVEFRVDTIRISIDFNRKFKVNTLINMDDKDTLFQGYISVYRGYYFMSESKNDSSYWIGVMRIDFDSIQGLGYIRKQMCALEEFLEQDEENGLILQNDTNNNIFRLRPDKKLMRDIYPELLTSSPKYRILTEAYDLNIDNQISIKEADEVKEENKQNKEVLIESLYPNPATDYIQVDFAKDGEYIIQLIDNAGKILLTKKISDIFVDLPLTDYPKGIYIIRARSIQDNLIENNPIIIR